MSTPTPTTASIVEPLPPERHVSGRRALLQMLDTLLAEERNIKTMRDAFQDMMNANPLAFFEKVVLPLMPKDSLSLAPNEDADESDARVVINIIPKEEGRVEVNTNTNNGKDKNALIKPPRRVNE